MSLKWGISLEKNVVYTYKWEIKYLERYVKGWKMLSNICMKENLYWRRQVYKDTNM